MNASFEERSLWIQLAAVGFALGAYFVIAGVMLARGITALPAYVPLFAVAVVLLVVLLIAGHAIAAIANRPEGRDERDRIIEWRAESQSSWILAVGVLTSIVGLILSLEPVWVAHLLLLSLFVSELTKFGCQLVYYRRGM